MAILALAVVPALVLENRSATPEIARAALTVNWIIWTGFCGEYLVKLALAPRRSAYVREAWFDLAVRSLRLGGVLCRREFDAGTADRT